MKNVIKFWSLAVVVALIAGFASCKKDDDKKDPSIEGKWQLVDAALTDECNSKSYTEFASGGKYRKVNACQDPIVITDGTWKKNGSKLTIKLDNGNTQTPTIDILTEEKLVLSEATLESTITTTYKRVVE